MLFRNGVFSPQSAAHPMVRAALCAAADHGPNLLRPSDLLIGLIRQGTAGLRAALARAAAPGSTLEAALRDSEGDRPAWAPRSSAPRTRASFTPRALEALDRFETLVSDDTGAWGSIAPELLAFCLASCLNESDTNLSPALDARLTVELLGQQIADRLWSGPGQESSSPPPGTGEEGEFDAISPISSLPPPPHWDDWTLLSATAEAPAASPFDGEPQYDRILQALTRALHRRQAHHVLLTGERGVGKTMVITELARRAAAGTIPSLTGRRFLHVDCRHVLPGEAVERLAATLTRVAEQPQLVVALDGLATLLAADPAGCKAVLLSALPQARCRLILLLTPHEYDEYLSGDSDLAEFFTRVEVGEPDVAVALKLLEHFARDLQEQFQVAIDPEAVRQAVVLSANYILNDHLPAKALKILHRACEDLDYERTHQGDARERVTADDAVRVVAEATGVPEGTLRGIAERSDYEQSLGEAILGQDHAVRAVATELGLIKAGMADPGKPASVMMFLGLTGTGKTEMAKALARFYSGSRKLKTYTLGNCVEPHSVATIIGVPPGYVGNDRGGRLVNELNADPYCVFLLDEADKAHPDVLQPFLNLFDEGWVADQRGVRAYADKAIFILTSNVGQRMIAELFQQGKGVDEVADRMREALPQIRHSKSERPVFTPEFLARIKRIIVFRPLDREAMAGISRKLVRELRQTWADRRDKALEVPEALVRYIGELAHELNEKSKGREGGRLVRKLIAEWVEAPLQREITRRPDEYRSCNTVVLEFTPPQPGAARDPAKVPVTTIRFTGSGVL